MCHPSPQVPDLRCSPLDGRLRLGTRIVRGPRPLRKLFTNNLTYTDIPDRWNLVGPLTTVFRVYVTLPIVPPHQVRQIPLGSLKWARKEPRWRGRSEWQKSGNRDRSRPVDRPKRESSNDGRNRPGFRRIGSGVKSSLDHWYFYDGSVPKVGNR